MARIFAIILSFSLISDHCRVALELHSSSRLRLAFPRFIIALTIPFLDYNMAGLLLSTCITLLLLDDRLFLRKESVFFGKVNCSMA